MRPSFSTLLSGFAAFLPTFASAVLHENSQFYPNPGIVAQRGGQWIGSDHLYNLTDKIEVVVEILKPEDVSLPLTSDMLKSRVESIFKKAWIQPFAANVPGKPPLPFFHLLLMIYPVENGYVAYCEGRLFEQVFLDRVNLDEQTIMQAITWESQNLAVASTAGLEDQVYKSVDEIADTFAERFTFYEKIRSQIQKR